MAVMLFMAVRSDIMGQFVIYFRLKVLGWLLPLWQLRWLQCFGHWGDKNS
jgi:hypothetical protein